MLSAVSAPFVVWLWLRVALFETGTFIHFYLTFLKKKKKSKTQLLFFSIFSSPCPHFLTLTTSWPWTGLRYWEMCGVGGEEAREMESKYEDLNTGYLDFLYAEKDWDR